MSIRYILYSTIMKIAHKYNWHYAPPIYPDGDTHLWCQWCGFRQTVKKAVKYNHTDNLSNGCMALKQELKNVKSN